MSTVKTFYAQVPLGIAMKKIEQHKQSEASEESNCEQKPDSETNSPARVSTRNGAELD